jgi:hypothetical protein
MYFAMGNTWFCVALFYQNSGKNGVFLQPERRHNLPPEAQRKAVELMVL